MATRPVTVSYPGQNVRAAWDTITNANSDGEKIAIADYSDKTVQVFGTFGGATLTIQGSNDGGTTWATLHDAQGTDLAFTAAGMELIAENPLLIRPLLSGGAGSDVDVFISGVKVL